MQYPTKKDVPRIVAALAPTVNSYLKVRAAAQIERERVTIIQRRVALADAYCTEEGERITDPERMWLISDEAASRYYAAMDVAYREAGYTVAPGHCPALRLEALALEAEKVLIEQAEPFFGVTKEQLTGGAWGKYIRLLACLVVGYREEQAAA